MALGWTAGRGTQGESLGSPWRERVLKRRPGGSGQAARPRRQY
jgi:hypothetical protein